MSKFTLIAALVAVSLFAGASSAPAPTTQDKRDIIINVIEADSPNAADLGVSVEIDFESDGEGTNLFADRSNGKPREKARTLVILHDGSGAPAAQLSVDVKALAKKKRRGLVIASRTEISEFNPELVAGRVRKARRPTVRFKRKWEQSILDGSDTVIENSMKLEIRVGGVGDNSVVLTRSTTDDIGVILEFEVFDAGLTSIGNGMVMVSATSAVSGGYTDGPIIVDDDDD